MFHLRPTVRRRRHRFPPNNSLLFHPVNPLVHSIPFSLRYDALPRNNGGGERTVIIHLGRVHGHGFRFRLQTRAGGTAWLWVWVHGGGVAVVLRFEGVVEVVVGLLLLVVF